MKPTDKAILGMVSKSPGRNGSEPTSGLENQQDLRDRSQLGSYFDTVRHHIVLEKVARRVRDAEVLWLLRLLLKA